MINPYMEIAIQEARKAAEEGEIPVGAVIVKDRLIISRTHNLRRPWAARQPMLKFWPLKKPVRFLAAGGWTIVTFM